MRYAIVENGIVANLIWLYEGNADEFPDAVALNNLPVDIGDTYESGLFYRNGVQVKTTEEEMSEALAVLGVTGNE